MPYDLTVTGHIVLDYITRKGKTRGPLVGGPCTHASLAVRALDSTVALVSKVGHDFGQGRLFWFRSHKISMRKVRVTNSPTTRFKINYSNGNRTMQVTSKCDPIQIDDVANLPRSRVVHIGSIIDEISESVMLQILTGNSVYCFDPQGFLRRLAPDGTVLVRKWNNPTVLKKINILKVTEDELTSITGKRVISQKMLSRVGPEIILVTRGPNGATVWSREDGMFRVPAYRTVIRDPTGAGDALVGVFAVKWFRTEDLPWSASVGSAAASFVVEKFGPANFGTRSGIEMRARKIFDGIVRI